MKEEKKKKLYEVGKTAWAVIGILLALWSVFWFLYARISGELQKGLISVILLGAGLKITLIYLFITCLSLIFVYIIKGTYKFQKNDSKNPECK